MGGMWMNEKINIDNIKTEVDGDLVFVTVAKYKLFLSYGKIGMDACLLYMHLIFTARLQQTNQVKANNMYLRQGLCWTKERLSKAKSLLFDLTLIETIQTRDKFNKFTGHYIKVKTKTTPFEIEKIEKIEKSDSKTPPSNISIGPESRTVDIQESGNLTPNALTKNKCLNKELNNINNIKDKQVCPKNISGNKSKNNYSQELKIPDWLIYTLKKGGYNPRNGNTKSMQRIVNYINNIYNHTFPKMEFNQEWFKKNKINNSIQKLNNITSYDDIRKLIQISIMRFNRMRTNENVWPENKKNLKQCAVADFFYNANRQTSWFLYCLENKPQPHRKVLAETKKMSVTSSLEKKYNIKIADCMKAIYRGNRDQYHTNVIGKWVDEDWTNFWMNIKDILAWYESNREGLKIINDNFHSYMKTPISFLNLIGDFLGEVFPDPKPRFLSMENKQWLILENWLEENKGLNIKINKKFIEKKKKQIADKKIRDKENEIRKEVNRIMQFLNEHGEELPPWEQLRDAAIKNIKDKK
jgi:hypothetical protein